MTVSDFLCAVALALALVTLVTFTLAVKEQKIKTKYSLVLTMIWFYRSPLDLVYFTMSSLPLLIASLKAI